MNKYKEFKLLLDFLDIKVIFENYFYFNYWYNKTNKVINTLSYIFLNQFEKKIFKPKF